MKIDLINQENSTLKSIDISDSVFKASMIGQLPETETIRGLTVPVANR